MKITKFLPMLGKSVVLLLGIGVSLHVSGGIAVAQVGPSGCVEAPGMPCSGGGSSGSSGGWSTPTYVPRGPSPAERARQRREDAADVANSKGIKYRKMGDYDTAIKYYREALRLDPNNSTIRENMGLALTFKSIEYSRKDDYDMALQYSEEALRYKPNDPDIRESIRLLRRLKGKKVNTIGVEYFNKGDYETAIKYFREALRFDPNGSVKQANLRHAQAKLKEQRKEQAKERKLAESKTKVKQMLDNMSEEFGSSTLPRGSLGFMSPHKPLVVKGSKGSSSEGLQFMDPRQEEQTTAIKRQGVTRVYTLPNKPTLPPGSSGITDPGAQLKSAEKTGKWAKGAAARPLDPHALERASGRAGIGFDTPGFKAGSLHIPKVQSKAPGVYSESPAVTDEDRRRIPSIVGLEKQRAQAINKLAAQEAKLEKLRTLPVDKRPKDWSVQIAKIKQAAINTKSEIYTADVKIGDALRLNKGKAERQAEVIKTPPKTEKPKKKGKETWTLD